MITPDRDNVFERARVALEGLLTLDFERSGRGLVRPETLTPEERKTWSDRWLGEEPGILKSVVDAATNPMVLFGAALTMIYPIATADRMKVFANKIENYAHRYFPGMRHLLPFNELFRDTPLVPLFERVTRTTHNWKETYSSLFTRIIQHYEGETGQIFDRKTGIKIAAYLDGLNDPKSPIWKRLVDEVPEAAEALKRKGALPEIRLNPSEQRVANEIRMVIDEQYARVKESLGASAQFKDEMASFMEAPKGATPADSGQASYFPHIERVTKEVVKENYETWLALLDSASRGYITETLPLRQYSKNLRERRQRMLPSIDDLREAGMATPVLEDAYQKMLSKPTEAAREGRIEPPARQYTLDVLDTAEAYTRGMARTYAWSGSEPGSGVPPVGPRVFEELRLLKTIPSVDAKLKATMLQETFIPMASGQVTWEQSIPSLRWTAAKGWAAGIIKELPIPGSLKNKLVEPLMDPRGASWQNIGNKMQGWLYLGALGGNIKSSVFNLYQNVITTWPVLGTKYTAKGVERVMRGIPKYQGMRAAGHDAATAFKSVWPEFAESALDIRDPAYEKFLDLVDKEMTSFTGSIAKKPLLKRASDTLMMPFTATERFNRLTSFYGAYRKALDELPGTKYTNPFTEETMTLKAGSSELQDAAKFFATDISRMTQFGGGFTGKPAVLLNRSGLVTQFLSFPMRVLALAAVGTRLGGEGGVNLGLLGRMVLGSGVAYEAGKSLFDADVSNALMFGALPGLASSPALGIIPAPPAVQLLFSGANAITGDADEFMRTLPVAIPGGVALSRLSGYIPGGAPVARFFGRQYADYNSPTPDGRIPLYSSKDTLLGLMRPAQMFGRMIGLGDMTSQREQALTHYLQSQGNRFKEFRNAALDAIMNSDMEKYKQINEEFKRAYPGLGDIPIKKDQIVAMQVKREVPRLEKALQALPPELRAAMLPAISVSLGAQGPQFLGTDPSLWGSTTIRQRFASRPSRQNVLGEMQSPLATGLTNDERLDSVRGAGEARRDQLAGQGFQALEAY